MLDKMAKGVKGVACAAYPFEERFQQFRLEVVHVPRSRGPRTRQGTVLLHESIQRRGNASHAS
jgi:hypothetical protein